MSKRTIVAVAVTLLLTIGIISAVFAQSATRTTEVRINARQVESGRVEFALQLREDDGWGERILLPGRFVPANVGHDRWLKTAPYTVSIYLPEAVEEVEDATSRRSESVSAAEGQSGASRSWTLELPRNRRQTSFPTGHCPIANSPALPCRRRQPFVAIVSRSLTSQLAMPAWPVPLTNAAPRRACATNPPRGGVARTANQFAIRYV